MQSPLEIPRRAIARSIRLRVAGPDAQERAARIWGAPGERWFRNEDPIAIVNGHASMYVGGIRALLLQSLHPLAMAGVAGHSGYRDDPWGRLQRTADYVAITTFARIEEAEALIDRVRRIHDKIKGTLPDGRAYAASDPHLLKWVHCAEIESFLIAYQRYGQRPLSPAECDAYVAQTALSAEKLGVVAAPRTGRELRDTLASYSDELEYSDATADVVDLLVNNPPFPATMLPAYRMLAAGAIATMPVAARHLLGLPSGRLGDQLWRHPLGSLATTGVRWALGQAHLSEAVNQKTAP